MSSISPAKSPFEEHLVVAAVHNFHGQFFRSELNQHARSHDEVVGSPRIDIDQGAVAGVDAGSLCENFEGGGIDLDAVKLDRRVHERDRLEIMSTVRAELEN